MSIMVTPASNQPGSNFNELWAAALGRYQDNTGRDLTKLPYFHSLIHSESVDDICRALQDREECFKAFRARGEKIRAVLAPIVRLARLFIDAGGEVAAASVRLPLFTYFGYLIIQQGVVPGGKAVFVAFGVLLEVCPLFLPWNVFQPHIAQATNGVSKVYDALESLLSGLQVFLARVDVHLASRSPPSAALKEIFTKTLIQLLHITALFTKYLDTSVGKPGLSRFTKHISRRASGCLSSVRIYLMLNWDTEDYVKGMAGNSELITAFEELDGLTREESLRTAAETLVATKEIGDDVKACMSFSCVSFSELLIFSLAVRDEVHEVAVDVAEILDRES
jgi:hypothetical protein